LPQDRTHEIHVYDSARIIPENFPKNAISSSSNALLWVSDPHFSDDHHRFSLISGHTGWDLSEAIRNDIEQFLGAREVAGLLLTGDLTWKAEPKEFDLAYSFIERVRSWATLQHNSNSVVVCPGNHDFAFTATPWIKGEPPTVAQEEAVKNYFAFYQKMYSTKPNNWFSSGRRFLIANSKAVEIISLNSSLLSQVKGVFQGHGFLGEDQLLDAAREMGWRRGAGGPRAFRIVMLHHHVVPIIHRELPRYEQQSSVVYDAGSLSRWLAEYEVDLVLHGHMHQATVLKESRTVNLSEGPQPLQIAQAPSQPALPAPTKKDTQYVAGYSLTEEGIRALTAELYKLKDSLKHIDVQRLVTDLSSGGLWTGINQACDRAGIECSIGPGHLNSPDDRGIKIYVTDMNNPPESAKKLQGILERLGLHSPFASHTANVATDTFILFLGPAP
jgi:3',5'-cyclic AMP phosphodiesterase CpdA